MKKTQLSLSIALAMMLVQPVLITGCSSSDSPTNVLGGGGGGGGGGASEEATNKTAFNTLVESELLFNPTVNGDTAQASQYLNGKLGVDGALTSAQATALNASIASAKAANPEHPKKAAAAVVDKVVMTKTYDVTVTADDIAAQRFVKKDLQLNPQQVTWTESDSDEDPREIAVLDGRDLAVVATDEYNYLYVIDTNSAEIKSQRHFAGVVGPRFAIDAITGASEHGLKYIKAAPDGNSVYVSVRPDDGDDSVGNAQDDRYGLFRILINSDGESFAHDDPSSKRYDSAHVGRFHVTADGQIFMEDTDADVIRILDADLNDTGTTLTLPTDIEAHRTFLGDDTVYISTRAVKADPDATPPVAAEPARLHKVNGQTGTTSASMDIEVSPDGLVIFDDGKQALIYEEDLYAAILDLTTMTETRRLPLSEDQGQEEIETATVTKDGRYAILAGHDNEQLWFFDLTLPVSRMEKLTPTDTRIRALATDDSGRVFAGGRTGFVDILKPVAGDVITPTQAVTQDVATLEGEQLNRNLPLSVIVKDLSLPTSVPGGGGSVISWGATVSSIDTATGESLGAVTRPAGQDEAGTLTATARYIFRDINATESKDFDVSVRKQANLLTAAGEMKLIGDLARVSPDAVLANADGSRVALQLKKRDSERKTHGGLVLASVDATGDLVPLSGMLDGGTQQVNGYIAFEPEEYGIGGVFRDDTVVSVTNTGRILSHTVNAADGALALSSSIDLPAGDVKRVGYSWDERYLGVLIGQNLENDDDADDNFLMTVFDLNDITSVTHKNDIQMGNPFTEFSGSYPRVAVGENGDSMFMRSGNGRIVLSRFDASGDGTAAKTAPSIEGEVTWALVARGDELLFGTFKGNVHSIDKDLDLATMKKFYSGFSGRTTVMYLRDDSLHIFIRGVGQITLDASDPFDLKEVDFLERSNLQYGGVSLDGMRSFPFGISGRNDDPQYSQLEYINLP